MDGVRYMTASGWLLALLLAVALAAAANYLIDRRYPLGRSLGLAGLAFLGVFGGSELFGELGSIASLSEIGPQVGDFYLLTGLVGGAILSGLAVLTGRRAAAGEPTDVAAQGITDPPVAHWLFADVRSAPLWFGLRVFLGYEWLAAGWHKVTDPAWMDGGTALANFWQRVTAVPEQGRPAITYGWYRDFLNWMLEREWYTWFAPLVAVGETLVGLALLLGAFVGIAAFFGTLMNFNFMLAGTASTNPVLFGLGVFLVLAWKVAGHWGLDRVILPALGAPWSPGKLFRAPARGPKAPTPA
ncbi:MAG: DoxX family membrane protein [Sphaerobacter sp.]|nr:DoxX family membrane protein [Sphaerobacter sp.]